MLPHIILYYICIMLCYILCIYIHNLFTLDSPCRHPASGYVQGINDLVTPFLAALLSQHFDGPMESWDIETLSEETMIAVEADAYWMLCKMLDGIQDHYTNAQPGIQRTVFKLKELVRCCSHATAVCGPTETSLHLVPLDVLYCLWHLFVKASDLVRAAALFLCTLPPPPPHPPPPGPPYFPLRGV